MSATTLVATVCPLCGADRAREVIAVADPVVDPDTTFPIGECLECGLARTLLLPPETELPRWYARHYGAFRTEAERHRGALRSAWQRLANMHPFDILAHVPRGGRLLEIGCGDGALLGPLARRAERALGVEPDAASAAQARARGLDVRALPIEAFDAGDERFDHVLFGFVLEHLADPVATLRRARRWLASSGRVHVFCPDYDSPFRTELGPHWQLWHVPYQRVFFTARTLGAVCAAAGLRLATVRHYTRGGVHALGEARAAGSRGLVPASGRMHELVNRTRGLVAALRGRGDCLAAVAVAAQDPNPLPR